MPDPLKEGEGREMTVIFLLKHQDSLVCIDLERGKVLWTKPGDSSGSVWSEDMSDGPSSTTRVGIAPLPCSIDTTFSWEQFLRTETEGELMDRKIILRNFRALKNPRMIK